MFLGVILPTVIVGGCDWMLRPMSYVSDLDELYKSQQTRDLGLVPTRYSYDDSHEEGAALNHPIEGDGHRGLGFGEH